MIINAASNSLFGAQMRINGQIVGGAGGLGLSRSLAWESGRNAETQSGPAQSSVYDNFGREMSRRLIEAAKMSGSSPDDDADPSLLKQSLVGAMGQIENLFGRPAAVEVMAKILTGTAEGLTEESLLSSLERGLDGLRSLDPNGTKLKTLTESFNADLALAGSEEEADRLEAGESFSLSYALARHFGSLNVPEDEAGATLKGAGGRLNESADNAGAPGQEPLTISGGGSFELSGFFDLDPEITTLIEPELPKPVEREKKREMVEMMGFDETGRWALIEVAKAEKVEDEELKRTAAEGIDQAQNLGLEAIIGQKDGAGEALIKELADFLRLTAGDEEAAAFVENGLKEARAAIENNYGKSPKLMDMISQVYSKVAADGDFDKLAALENYINADFKAKLNPILAELQQGMVPLLPGGEVGELEFQGLSGLSAAGESDVFALKWGYKGDAAFDRSLNKRFMHEDIQPVKEASDKQKAEARRTLAQAKAQMEDEKELRRQGYLYEVATPEEVLKANREAGNGPVGDIVPGYSHLGRDPGENRKIWNDLKLPEGEDESDQSAEGEVLAEAMAIKVGQMSDGARAELEKYLRDNFEADQAEAMLRDLDWKNDLMSALADVHRDIRERGSAGQAEAFVNFLNGGLKEEVQVMARRLGGLEFDGWQSLDGSAGELAADFRLTETQNALSIAVLSPGKKAAPTGENAAGLAAAEKILQTNLSSQQHQNTQKVDFSAGPRPNFWATGQLINLVA